MRGRLGLAAACAVAVMVGAVDAHAADVRGVEVRPGIPGLVFGAEPGEANDVRLIPKTRVSTSASDLGGIVSRVITVVDDGATLTTGGAYPCRLLSAHKARCVSFGSTWTTIELWMKEGPDRVRMPARVQYPTTTIYSDGGGNRFTVRGPNTWVWGAFTGDSVRFRPPGGGGVIIGGSPRLWLFDGASESVDCREAGSPHVVSDPLDQFASYC